MEKTLQVNVAQIKELENIPIVEKLLMGLTSD